MISSNLPNRIFALCIFSICCQISCEASAQRRPFQIGGPNGVVMGGGMGFKVGGRNGVQFGGGQGARFGPADSGVQFGAGQGARFGPSQTGVQFGGGQGAKFGSLQFGGQSANGASDATTAGTVGGGQANSAIQTDRKVLRLEANASKPVAYSLNGTQFQLRPGSETILQQGQQWSLSFLPGPGQAARTIAIDKPGIYLFREGTNGWELSVNSSGDSPTMLMDRPGGMPTEMVEEPVLAPTPSDDSSATPAEVPLERSVLELAPPVMAPKKGD